MYSLACIYQVLIITSLIRDQNKVNKNDRQYVFIMYEPHSIIFKETKKDEKALFPRLCHALMTYGYNRSCYTCSYIAERSRGRRSEVIGGGGEGAP